MNPILFYDTETSGLPIFNEPSEDPRQPHVVQLGAILADPETRKEIAVLDVICKPDGWTIPDDVAAVHGITTEHAAAVGIPERLAVELLLELTRGATFRVAHNESFDARIIRIGCFRHFDEGIADEWKGGASMCTAQMSTPILKLPPTAKMVAAGRRHSKTPNLGEAYQFFTGQVLEGAHSALVDARACMTCYFAMLDRMPQAA